MHSAKGKILIGDGLQFISALKKLQEKYEAAVDGGAGDEEQEFDRKFINILNSGLTVDFVRFKDDSDFDQRYWHYSAAHDDESTKYKATSLSQKINVIAARFKRRINHELVFMHTFGSAAFS